VEKTEDDMTYSLEELADRMAIQDAIALYVHAFDEFDFDALDAVFTPETVFDFSRLNGGTRDWPTMKAYLKMHHRLPRDQHIYGNISIEFNADRSEAKSKSKVFNPQALLDERQELHKYALHGVYHDLWRKAPDGWRITARSWQLSFIDGDYPYDSPPGANLPSAEQIRRESLGSTAGRELGETTPWRDSYRGSGTVARRTRPRYLALSRSWQVAPAAAAMSAVTPARPRPTQPRRRRSRPACRRPRIT
jgi:hypothetical protein